MAMKDILATVDEELARLKQARAILAQDRSAIRGKPVVKKGGKQSMSSAGRKAIAEAQRKRWAALKAGK